MEKTEDLDIKIRFCTENGSGSSTANNIILKAIFKMGIPVSGRNFFPSNIQGLPTWYYLRINSKGFLARREMDDIVVIMNPVTAEKDLENINPGGYVIINESIQNKYFQEDVTFLRVPVDRILKDSEAPSNLLVYLSNVVYVGILAFLIGIDLLKINEVLDQHFNGNKKAIDVNMKVIQASYEWSQANAKEIEHFYLKPSSWNKGKIMVDGNTAAALGALYGGLQFSAWYPITPATSLAETISEFLPSLRTDKKTGRKTCVVVQAEDELAAIGMVVGAGWAGLRSMTSTSGPGLCLMSEYLGLAYFAEVPLVVWNVQRVGPSTGLPTHTSQGDLTFTYFMSHGDKNYIILLPANPNECFEFGWKALDIAEVYQTPVIVLSDLELGMDEWATDAFKYPETKIQRGKILWEDELENIIKMTPQGWGRYLDIDGDGIPYRTIPGNSHPQSSYLARGTGHDEFANYSEKRKDWEKNLNRLSTKVLNASEKLPDPEINEKSDSKVGIISYGTTDSPVREAIELENKNNQNLSYMRIKALPFKNKVKKFISKKEKIFVVENNRDGQMYQLLCMNYPEYANRIIRIAHCDGASISTDWVIGEIEKHIA